LGVGSGVSSFEAAGIFSYTPLIDHTGTALQEMRALSIKSTSRFVVSSTREENE
jgi:hypothetical protein